MTLAACILATAAAQAPSDAQDKSAAQSQPSPQDKAPGKDQKPVDPTLTRLRIRVNGNDKPIGNASVYVKFYTPGGFLHKEKLAELNFKTNEDGSVKVPEIPRGKVLIQVIAKGWHTYGEWFDIQSEEQTIEVKLKPPATRWY